MPDAPDRRSSEGRPAGGVLRAALGPDAPRAARWPPSARGRGKEGYQPAALGLFFQGEFPTLVLNVAVHGSLEDSA
jgi:hypothetical protein